MVSENVSAKAESTRAEYDRQDEARTKGVAWSKWGPYLSERQWGTVREDYENGAGLGASHQTGWTGLIAYLMKISALITPEAALSTESAYAAIQVDPHKPTST